MKRKRNKSSVTKKRAVPVKEPSTGPAPIDRRYAAALARGKIIRKKLMAAEGGAVSVAKAARLLGISKTAVLKRWQTYRLVGWSDGKNMHFPVWQFRDGKLLPGIKELLQIFRSDEQWRVLMYFLGNRESLKGERPLDLLRRGEASRAIEHATDYAQDGTW